MDTELSFKSQDFQKLYYIGMGGSALAAEVFNNLYGAQKRLFISRHYELPPQAGPQDLILSASFSGNTEETLSAFSQAVEKKLPLIALSHGGQLESRCQEKKLNHLKLPPCIQPRYALGYFFGSLLGLFHRLKLLPSYQDQLQQLETFLGREQKSLETQGKALADFFFKKTALLYGAQSLQSALQIFKIKINENAKAPAFHHYFPELNHNEMVGLSQLPGDFALLLLENQQAHPKIRKRLQVFKEFLQEKQLANLAFTSFSLPGNHLIEEIFSAVLLGDYTSYYLAKKYDIDPVPVSMIEDFKKKL